MDNATDAWYTQRLRRKPEKAVVRLYNNDGTFLAAVNTPTDMWPLNASYEVFHAGNCQLLENETVAGIVDTVPYHIGHCYGNAQNVTKALQDAGYAATQYCGWLFVGEQYPIHHSWTVLDGKHIIDLADEFAVMNYNRHYFEDKNEDDARNLLIDFHKWIRQFKNSERIMPFGVPTGLLLYIGCPCSREEGIDIYNKLVQRYPDHPCTERLVKGENRTKMQMMLHEAGLMD